MFGCIVYGEGKERFGEIAERKKNPREIGRCEQEICKEVLKEVVVKGRWQREGRSESTLGAECIQKWRSNKENKWVRFFQDPFNYAYSLLKEKSGMMEYKELAR